MLASRGEGGSPPESSGPSVGSSGNRTLTPGPRGIASTPGTWRGRISSLKSSDRLRSGPDPEAEPVVFRWMPEERPLPVPWPLPDESPGPSWPHSIAGDKTASQAMRTLGYLDNKSARHMGLYPSAHSVGRPCEAWL